MNAVPPNQQQSLVERLTKMCGGGYSPDVRRKYFISGPQWAAAYQGQALFFAPTRKPITYEDVIREFGRIGIGYWTTHDSDVIPSAELGTDRQKEIVGRIQETLKTHGVKCSMVTTETFFHEVFAAGPAAESPEIREYTKFRVTNTVDIGHELVPQLRAAGGKQFPYGPMPVPYTQRYSTRAHLRSLAKSNGGLTAT